jgi:hypothetical protein
MPTHVGAASGFRAGVNCLRVVVTNSATAPTGFNLVGMATAASDLCCEGGTICGLVYFDQNRNEIMEAGEPGLDDWTIVLRDANGRVLTSAITADNGRYCFMNVAPGTYLISEVLQSGWIQTSPLPPSGSPPGTLGTYEVRVTPKEVIQHQDFGNRIQ